MTERHNPSAGLDDPLRPVFEHVAAQGWAPDDLTRCLAAALDLAQCGVYLKDTQGRYLYLNAAAAGLLGQPVSALIGRTDEEVLDPDTVAAIKAGDGATGSSRFPAQREERVAGRDVSASRRYVELPGGNRVLCCTWADLGELRRAQVQLRHALSQLEQHQRENETLRMELHDQAVRDPVSGVYTTRHFEEQMRREIDLSQREHREFALVAIRIDGYAAIAAGQAGEKASSRILQAVGRLLRSNTRAMDAPCRLGEDRFAVLLSGIGLATAHSRMESVRRQCEAQIVMVEGREVRFTVSMGVASFPHTAEERTRLMAAADAALEEAQRRGGNCVMMATIPFEVGAAPGSVPAA
jgi:diguanylate cyclase (GGDEF)-like protein